MTSTSERDGGRPPGIRMTLGVHWVVELVDCDPEKISTVVAVKPVLIAAIEASRATPLRYSWHQFEPHGMSATVLIAESHFCMHTWPEHGYVAFDIFTCGDMDAQRAIDLLAAGFRAERAVTTRFPRGIPR